MLLPAVMKPSPMSWARRLYGVPPAYPPVPFTFMRPVHALPCGSQTSHLISESDVGFAVPCTRHIGTVTVCPPTIVLAATGVADVTVDPSGVTDARAAHDK